MAPPQRRRAAARALPILLLTLLAIALIAYIFWGTATAVNQNVSLPAAACDGVANRRLPRYETTPGIHPVSAFRAVADRWVPDAQAVAAEWVPAAPSGTELVLCIMPPEPLTLPNCNQEQDPVVYGYAQPLTLVAAATATTVAETMIASVTAPTAACLEPDAVAPRAVTTLQIQAWLSRHAYIP